MTTEIETNNVPETIANSQLDTVIQESPISESDKNQDESIVPHENKQQNTLETEQKNNINDDIEINSNPTTTTTLDNNSEQEHKKPEAPANNIDDDHRYKRYQNSKYKYPAMIHHRSPYYMNGYPYGPAPYYYYHPAVLSEKPPPLMVIPTQTPATTTSSSSTTTTTTTTTTTSDSQTSNSTAVSSQNLPPRLRQASTNDNDSNAPPTATTSSSKGSSGSTSQLTTNGRRQRSILPRGSCNYYSSHPPPPLMATPPGVLFPYPPTFHQSGHIAYNIRTPDEFDLLAFQQPMMNVPPLIWPPSGPYGNYPPYVMGESVSYLYNHSSAMNSNNSLLNPEAAEWVPPTTATNGTSNDNILIDDEINFPPLNNNANNNNNRPEENNTEQQSQTNSSSEIDTNNNNNNNNNNSDDKTTIVSSKTDITNANSSASQDDSKIIPSSKATTISYSNVILQTLDTNKLNKTVHANNQNQRRQPQSTNNTNVSIPPRDRTAKQQQKSQIFASKDNSTRRVPTSSNRNVFDGARSSLATESSKPQQQLTDDWIEVKSKKMKKFDRSVTDIHYENPPSAPQKSLSDQQITKTLSPPSSLSSNSDNAMGTSTSEEDDEKDYLNNIPNNNHDVNAEDNMVTTTIKDYNQCIIDDIHQRLDNHERLLIIMRGCPGSGKSTLAQSLSNGYKGQILSTDEYFKDKSSNEYRFDSSKLEEAHRFNHRLASDALRKNISPIIIDNTNTTRWEMKPYATMGKEAGYAILLIEPQTPWRYKARELVKQCVHNVTLRRIKEMLSRFEHNVTVESLIDQTKSNVSIMSEPKKCLNQNETINEPMDTLTSSKKSPNVLDDANILDDVRLCINDMILFLTSNFYQTSQSSTSLSISFSDLSLIPSSPSPTTPSTPHSLFHRSLPRFPSTTTSQDLSFSNEHLLRLPAQFSRCIEKMTPPSSTNSSIIGKKRRKNKNKQHESNEFLLNTNNNNNHICYESLDFSQHPTYDVILAEEYSNFIVIDEQIDSDCLDFFNQQINACRNHSSVILHQQKSTTNTDNELLNIIHSELTKPSTLTARCPSNSFKHVAVQCSANDFNQKIDLCDRILIGHLTDTVITTPSISPLPGFVDCGIQVDFIDNSIESLSKLCEFYSDMVSPKIIKDFYETCNSDIQLTRTCIDDYLQSDAIKLTVPTLRQLSYDVLNHWNEQLQYSNPSCDTISIGDLLQDINDEEVFEDIIQDNVSETSNPIQFTDSNQIKLPWSYVNSLQELYGELPIEPSASNDADGLTLPLDDDLSMSIYQALQRLFGVPTKTNKPVNDRKATKENKKMSKQRWNLPSPQQRSNNNANKNTSGPSLAAIMHEELQCINAQKPAQKRQLDFASQHKLKELERCFPGLPSEVLYDMFVENECDYDLTLACVSSMLDESAPVLAQKVQSPPALPKTSSVKRRSYQNETDTHSYEVSRYNAREYALKRKDCYNKADQANRHGMIGVASFYINQAREQTRLMKDANRTACELLSQTRLDEFRRTNRLDLHDLYTDEALALFKQVERELNEGNKRTTAKGIEIITGYGKRSPYGGGNGKIRATILSYIKQKNYKYSEPNKGAFFVQF